MFLITDGPEYDLFSHTILLSLAAWIDKSEIECDFWKQWHVYRKYFFEACFSQPFGKNKSKWPKFNDLSKCTKYSHCSQSRTRLPDTWYLGLPLMQKRLSEVKNEIYLEYSNVRQQCNLALELKCLSINILRYRKVSEFGYTSKNMTFCFFRIHISSHITFTTSIVALNIFYKNCYKNCCTFSFLHAILKNNL